MVRASATEPELNRGIHEFVEARGFLVDSAWGKVTAQPL